MKIKCDKCQQKNKGRYSSFFMGDTLVTLCEDCRWGNKITRVDKTKKLWEEINTPFWKMMGQKPKPKDIALEKMLKDRGMTYGDYRKERDFYQAKHPSALPQFENHIKKYGRLGQPPKAEFKKNR